MERHYRADGERAEVGTYAAVVHILILLASLGLNVRYGRFEFLPGLSVTWGALLGNFLWPSLLITRILADTRTTLGVAAIGCALSVGMLGGPMAWPLIGWQFTGTAIVLGVYGYVKRRQGGRCAFFVGALAGQFLPPIIFALLIFRGELSFLVGTALFKALSLPTILPCVLVARWAMNEPGARDDDRPAAE